MLQNLMNTLQGRAQRLNGRTDLLEAICAAAALVAAADGDISDDEVDATVKSVTANHLLAGAFPSRTIESTINTMMNRASGGRTGRAGLWKEIRDLRDKDKEERELIYLSALDIAESEGAVSDKERPVLEKIASELALKTSDYEV